MKYNEFIKSYLAKSKEPVGKFAKRAGVHRSTVYRATAGEGNLMFHMVAGMVSAAGGEIFITPTAPATRPSPAEVGGDAA